MPDLDDLLHRAVEQRHMPFAVAMVADRDDVRWSGAVGKSSPQAEADLNTVFRIFSMGKAIGSLAALILVDRGLLTLETPVGSVLEEFGDIRVLDSFGPAGPVLRPPRRPVTVRHLLTNTAGFAYEGWNSRQALYALMTGALHPNSGARIAIKGPLMFDPGDGMTYGYGFDWIGSLVARLDGRDAVTFCQDEIFDPIGMPDTMFEPDRAGARLAQTSMRSPDDSFTPFDVSPPAKPEIYGLGQCLYGTAPDYMQFLRFILNDGEIDGRHLLSREVMAMMKTPQSGGLTMPLMKTMAPLLSADVELVTSSVTTWTAGFLQNQTDVPGKRSAGSLTWAGFLNTHYWVDHRAGIAAVLMTQLLPFADERFMTMYDEFERAVYTSFGHPPSPTSHLPESASR